MERSEINRVLKDMEKVIDRCSSKLPPFCYFTPEEWKEKERGYDEARNNILGQDITDFEVGDFGRMGSFLITLRNGNVSMDKYTESYVEKLLYMKEGQSIATHFHWNKMEDIINKGGGNVPIDVYNIDKEEGLADTNMLIHSNGREYVVPVGMQIRLRPGESVTIQPCLYHGSHLEPGTGLVLLGEVSMYNDDNRDNRFYLPADRFPIIEEDEPPFRLLRSEYPPADSCAKRWKFMASEWKTVKVVMKNMTNVM